MELQRRKWVPDINMIADQLIRDFSTEDEGQGSLDINSTLDSWQATAQFHGDQLTEDDWGALVKELVRRIVLAPEEW
jgi:hypothetical protein